MILLFSYVAQNAAVAMEAMQACLAVVAAIVSIWGSAICCKAVCCCSNSTYGGVSRPTSFVIVTSCQLFVTDCENMQNDELCPYHARHIWFRYSTCQFSTGFTITEHLDEAFTS
jgi:hypothetical protein